MDDRIPPVSYAPDGLYESDIDVLLVECFGVADEQADVYDAPMLVDRATAYRRIRRIDHQSISAGLRGLPAA